MAADGNGPDPYLAGEEGAAWTGLSAPERGERAARPESSHWVEEQGVHDQNRWEMRSCVAASNLLAREVLLLLERGASACLQWRKEAGDFLLCLLF
jgi:hypothetical protein